MLYSIKDTMDYDLQAIDGEIGKILDFYVDDRQWSVRYVVADTRNWLPGRRVLIPVDALLQPDHEKRLFNLSITREAVKNSPGEDIALPLSRSFEASIRAHYGWPVYWTGPGGLRSSDGAEQVICRLDTEDFRIRSLEELSGYHIQARDGEIGYVSDFVYYDADWKVRYVEIDTRKLLPGKKVLLPAHQVLKFDMREDLIGVPFSVDHIKNAPKHSHKEPVDHHEELEVLGHFDSSQNPPP